MFSLYSFTAPRKESLSLSGINVCSLHTQQKQTYGCCCSVSCQRKLHQGRSQNIISLSGPNLTSVPAAKSPELPRGIQYQGVIPDGHNAKLKKSNETSTQAWKLNFTTNTLIWSSGYSFSPQSDCILYPLTCRRISETPVCQHVPPIWDLVHWLSNCVPAVRGGPLQRWKPRHSEKPQKFSERCDGEFYWK